MKYKILESLKNDKLLENEIICNKGTLFESNLKRTLVDIVTIENKYISVEESLKTSEEVKTVIITNQLTGKKLIKKISEISNIEVFVENIIIYCINGTKEVFER